jgi:hypothetical protein
VWKVATGERQFSHEFANPIKQLALAFSGDKELLVLDQVDTEMKLWRLPVGSEKKKEVE